MRVWVYQTLKLSGLWIGVEGRFYQTSMMTKVPDEPPYAYYRMGISRPALHSDHSTALTPFQIFVHDVPGDYSRIETLLAQARTALTSVPALVPEPRLIQCTFLELSGDVPQDPTTGTIAKSARFNLAHT